jgi:large subunit ribosomal protein L24e
MVKCSFCGGTLPIGQGKMYVKLDGRILYFCSSKCERNTEMGRDPKKRKWTEAAAKARVKAKK